jgi:hypothetical protein
MDTLLWLCCICRSTVACCSEQDYDNYEYDRDNRIASTLNLDIGSCEITYFFFPEEIIITNTLSKVGTFKGIW